LSKRTVLLTGATGFLGSHLLKALLGRGYAVSILVRSSSDTLRIDQLLSDATVYDLSATPIPDIFLRQHFDAIIHTACSYGPRGQGAAELLDSNLLFPLKLLECAATSDVAVFVNAGTLLPRGVNAYSLSKAQFTDWLSLYSTSISIKNLRIEHMYGSGDNAQRFLPWLLGELNQGVAALPLTAGEQLRDFIHVSDVARAFLLVLEKSFEAVDKTHGMDEFDVGSGTLTSIRDFVQRVCRQYECSGRELKTVAKFGAISYREGELMEPELNIEPLCKLGWKPLIGLDQGIEMVLGELQ
jgi:CDP-paratose synthetase